MVVGGVLLAASPNFETALAGRLISGTGGILLNQAITKMATDWFVGREIVFAMAVVLASWPFGIAAGLITQGWLAESFGWPVMMQVTAALCALALALVLLVYRPPAAGASSASRREGPFLTLPSRVQIAPIVIAGAIWACANLGLVLFFSFMPRLLQELGYSEVAADSLPSTALWILMLSVPVGGYLIERRARPGGSIILCAGASALLLGLLAIGVSPPLLCAAFGAVMGLPAGAILALPARLLGPQQRAAGFGLFFTCHYGLMTLGPPLAGWLYDRWGSSTAPLLFGAALSLASAPLLLLFKRQASEGPAIVPSLK
jgi:predicted MFS family arabinose efflux permease